MNRRAFIARSGALVVSFSLLPRVAGAQAGKLPGSLSHEPLLDAWIRVGADGRITVFTGKAELGQGVKTALIQIAADELAVPPNRIELITADTARTPDEGVTAGSRSLSDSGMAILNAGANVRVLLIETAAWRLSSEPDEIELRDGVAHAPNGESLSYGELAAMLSLHVEAKPDVPRRTKGERLIGLDLPRVDIPAKVSGGAAYVQDRRLPGMLHARVVRGPSDGTRLKSADLEAVAAMPSVFRPWSTRRMILCWKSWRAEKPKSRWARASRLAGRSS